jgi:hypothetical protein
MTRYGTSFSAAKRGPRDPQIASSKTSAKNGTLPNVYTKLGKGLDRQVR